MAIFFRAGGLEKDCLVKHTVYAEVPTKVEYELIDIGSEFVPIFRQLSVWGGKNKNSGKEK